jgi:hypothetical protein
MAMTLSQFHPTPSQNLFLQDPSAFVPFEVGWRESMKEILRKFYEKTTKN